MPVRYTAPIVSRWFVAIFSVYFALAASLLTSPFPSAAELQQTCLSCQGESPADPQLGVSALEASTAETLSDVPEMLEPLGERYLAGAPAGNPPDAGMANLSHPFLDGPHRPPRGQRAFL